MLCVRTVSVDDLRKGVALFLEWIEQMPYLQQVEERAK